MRQFEEIKKNNLLDLEIHNTFYSAPPPPPRNSKFDAAYADRLFLPTDSGVDYGFVFSPRPTDIVTRGKTKKSLQFP